MSLVNIINVTVLNNPTHFSSAFQFQIQFECLQELPEDLDWKLTYVGNAESSQDDQILEELSVGPMLPGLHAFVLQAPAPNPIFIKNQDLIGVTVILLTCSYLDQMFVQIGYYVENEYAEPFEPENYPNPVNIALLNRNIVANEPRVTRYAIDWTGQNPVNNQLLLEHELADGQTNQDYEDTKEGEAEEEGDEDDEEDEEGDEEDDDDDEGDAEIDLDEKEEEDEADMMNDDEGEADAQDVIVNQFILNEDSMDVHAMQIEHSSHSHSHSGSYRDLI